MPIELLKVLMHPWILKFSVNLQLCSRWVDPRRGHVEVSLESGEVMPQKARFDRDGFLFHDERRQRDRDNKEKVRKRKRERETEK